METSELEMTPPDSPKATKEEKKGRRRPRKTSSATSSRRRRRTTGRQSSTTAKYWSNYKTPEDTTFHAQNRRAQEPTRARQGPGALAAAERALQIQLLRLLERTDQGPHPREHKDKTHTISTTQGLASSTRLVSRR